MDATTPDPVGGKIYRDRQTGEPSGLFEESAHFTYVWPAIPRLSTTEDRIETALLALDSFVSQGVTTVVDMAMEMDTLTHLRTIIDRYKSQVPGFTRRPPVRVICHWLVQPSETADEDLAQVYMAKELQLGLEREGYSPWLRITGIKLFGDGVIDSCTASLHEPYHDGSNADAIWAPTV